MSYQLNSKLCDLKPYDPIEGDYKIRLDANESFININNILSDKISNAVEKSLINRYPDPYANGATKAFADFYNIDKKLVTAGNGSDELISIITSCFLEKGDNVVTLSNDFSMYSFYGSLYELNILRFERSKDNLTLNVDELISYCNKENAKMLIFSNPCNPTSLGLKKNEVIKIIKNINCLIVVDEAYMDFWSESILDDISTFDNVIILKTCSKALGLAGLRFGFAISSPIITNALKAAKSPYNTDTVTQNIVETVMLEKAILKDNINKIILSTKSLYEQLNFINYKINCFETIFETCTNFVFIKTNKAKEIYQYLLKKSIAIRCFNGYLRITAGNDSENKAVIKAIKEFFNF